MTLHIDHLHRRFTDFAALNDVSLDIPPGEFLALLGPSGSGKTTLLRILAGLDHADEGAVVNGGEDFLAMPARHRNVGLVFQHYALFRHMSVAENIAFGLRVRPRRTRPSREKIRSLVDTLLKRVELEGMGDRFPAQISGGQRQRVALARALAVEPEILLLDEPFGALDAKVRVTLRRWLRALHEDLDLTTIFVTHDQEEALELADRIAVMDNGRVEQVGSPQAIYEEPASPFVCEFIGRANRIVLERGLQGLAAGGWSPRHTHVPEWVIQVASYVRPEHLAVGVPDSEAGWHAHLRHIYLSGSVAHLELHVAELGRTLEADVGSEELQRRDIRQGTNVRIAPRRAILFGLDGHSQALRDQRWTWQVAQTALV